jgi:serine/threonine protein phosphatase PrpC
MDDEHVAFPALEKLDSVIASDSHLTDSTTSQQAANADDADDGSAGDGAVQSPGNRLLEAMSSGEPPASDSRDASTPLAHGKISLYGVFDGHAGNSASAFAAKDLPARLRPALESVLLEHTGTDAEATAGVGQVVCDAFAASDAEFDRRVAVIEKDKTMVETLLPGTGGHEAGTTAIVVAIDWATSRLVVAGAGDCRAVLVHRASDLSAASDAFAAGTAAAEPGAAAAEPETAAAEPETAAAEAGAAAGVSASTRRVPGSLWLGHAAAVQSSPEAEPDASDSAMVPVAEWPASLRQVLGWDLLPLHSPAAPDETRRIEAVGGWVTHSHDIIVPDFGVLDESWEDSFIVARLRVLAAVMRTGSVRIDIHRVCGDLGVSRAIGDVDFKLPRVNKWKFSWNSAPGGTKRSFSGDLVSCTPDVRVMSLTSSAEALVIACDGLWDVICPADAARAVAEVLRANAPPKVAARRLAEAAIRLGSTDNVTVLVVDLRGSFD